MSVFRTLAEVICDYWDYRNEQDRIYDEEMRKRRAEKKEKRQKKQKAEFEFWMKLNEEEYKNPDEFRVLPYGWSPFGIVI